MDPGLRGNDLPLDAGQELLALGQAQTQGAQIGKGIRLGDPHDIGAVFFALSSDADQPHDPGHVASTSAGIQARKYLFRSRAPNLAAVPMRICDVSPSAAAWAGSGPRGTAGVLWWSPTSRDGNASSVTAYASRPTGVRRPRWRSPPTC